MKVLIDADACPVLEIAAQECRRRRAALLLFCDTSHELNVPSAQTVTVSRGADSADFALVNRAEKGDLVVTQDYGLAAMCLAKGARVLNQDGKEYRSDNIEGLLAARWEHKKQRMAGKHPRGPKKRTAAQDQRFREAFSALLDALMPKND